MFVKKKRHATFGAAELGRLDRRSTSKILHPFGVQNDLLRGCGSRQGCGSRRGAVAAGVVQVSVGVRVTGRSEPPTTVILSSTLRIAQVGEESSHVFRVRSEILHRLKPSPDGSMSCSE